MRLNDLVYIIYGELDTGVSVGMIRMYCIIVRRGAWARLLMVIGTPEHRDQPRSVLGFYGRLRDAISAFSHHPVMA
jgi:hypothetical protein